MVVLEETQTLVVMVVELKAVGVKETVELVEVPMEELKPKEDQIIHIPIIMDMSYGVVMAMPIVTAAAVAAEAATGVVAVPLVSKEVMQLLVAVVDQVLLVLILD